MAYTRVNWQNSPSHATPLSAENLNVMDAAIEELDGAVTDVKEDLTLETEARENLGSTLASLGLVVVNGQLCVKYSE